MFSLKKQGILSSALLCGISKLLCYLFLLLLLLT